MSGGGAYRSMRMRAEVAAGIHGKPPADITTPFTDADFRLHSRFRELRDAIDPVRRWRVVVIPADGARRDYVLLGTLESVEARAKALFPGPLTRTVLIEAERHPGPEVLDPRLCMSI